jgi:hypothetical protein
MRTTLLFLFLVICAPTSFAQSNNTNVSANTLITGCQAFLQPTNSSNMYYQGYCAGIVRGMTATSSLVCTPEGATVRQGVAVVVQYLNRIPARHHEPFVDLAEEALIAARPCKR